MNHFYNWDINWPYQSDNISKKKMFKLTRFSKGKKTHVFSCFCWFYRFQNIYLGANFCEPLTRNRPIPKKKHLSSTYFHYEVTSSGSPSENSYWNLLPGKWIMEPQSPKWKDKNRLSLIFRGVKYFAEEVPSGKLTIGNKSSKGSFSPFKHVNAYGESDQNFISWPMWYCANGNWMCIGQAAGWMRMPSNVSWG